MRLMMLLAVCCSTAVLAQCSSPKGDDSHVRELRQKAEQGDADAQYELGWMYDNGEGVPENDAEAVKWYRLAAEQGDALAQNNLGVMNARGEGVPQNDLEAYFWLNLAAAQGVTTAKESKAIIEKRGMTREQIAEAQRRSAVWQPKTK
jgi:TPR repeat protein